MNRDALREIANNRAKDFLENEKDFQLGSIEAEQSHPLTRNMSDVFSRSVSEGASMLVECDRRLADAYKSTLESDYYRELEKNIQAALKDGGRIILSGCGSSGRLCMRLENSFRLACERIGKSANPYADKVLSLMTGGDYAVIRAVESFEDFTALGRKQAEELHLGEKDLLIGVTATGETTSILGTASRALDDGATVWMVICSDPDAFYHKIPRAATVYHRPRSEFLLLPCGPMALTGSTRMQSSTYEQVVLGTALDRVLASLTAAEQHPLSFYSTAFSLITAQMAEPTCIHALVEQISLEEDIYRNNGLITYFSDEYLLDVLTDTTERSPTFMTPPFVSASMSDQIASWAFVKDPEAETEESWTRCFRRVPRCIEWDHDTYRTLGLKDETIDRIPPIGLKALYEFRIGQERSPDREQGTAVWVGDKEAPVSFTAYAAHYQTRTSFSLEAAGITPPATKMDLFEHLSMKMLLNNFSTATMVRMGRVQGNRMTFLNISNKKLVDRAGRIISQMSGLPYDEALRELFYTEELLKEQGELNLSATQETLKRLLKL